MTTVTTNGEISRRIGTKYGDNSKRVDRLASTETKNSNPKWFWAYLSLYNHKRLGYQVQMSTEELYGYAKNIDSCEDCGVELTWGYGHGQNAGTPSLDRRDNDGPVKIDNIAIVCKKCDSVKRDKTMAEWRVLTLGGLRRCGTCRKVKPLDQFYSLPPKGSPSHYDSRCKECKRILAREVESKNRVYYNEYRRNLYRKNKLRQERSS
jgi:hypothetical protein